MKKFLLLLTLFLSLAGIAKATETTVTFGTLYSSVTSNQSLKDKSFDVDNVVTFTFGGSGNATQYYNNGKNVRIYQNNTITVKVSKGYAVTKIAFTGVSGNAFHSNFKPSIGTCPANGNNATWSGNLSNTGTLTFTNSGTQIRCTDVTVTYEPVHKNLGDITVSYSGVDVTENSTVSVPNGTVFNIAAENATSITINGTETSGATATYTATTSETVNVSATDGTATKWFSFTTDVYTAPDAPIFTVDGVSTGVENGYFYGATLSMTGAGSIYYTTDGSTPSATEGTPYSEAIALPEGATTYKAIVNDGNHDSAVTSTAYTVKKLTAAWSVTDGAEVYPGTEITATASADAATIFINGAKASSYTIPEDAAIGSEITLSAYATIAGDNVTATSETATITLKVVEQPTEAEITPSFFGNSLTGNAYKEYSAEDSFATYKIVMNYLNNKIYWNTGASGVGANSGLIINCKTGYFVESIDIDTPSKTVTVYTSEAAYNSTAGISNSNKAGEITTSNTTYKFQNDTPQYVGLRPSGSCNVVSITVHFKKIGSNKPAIKIAWSAPTFTTDIVSKDVKGAPVLSVTPPADMNESDALALVKYSSSKPSVATIDNNGTLEVFGLGATEIKAYIDDTDYQYEVTSYKLVVLDPNAVTATDRLEKDCFEDISNSYSTFHYTSPTTGITYAACTNYNSNKSGMTLNDSGKGSAPYFDPGFGVAENTQGWIAKKITVKYSETINPSEAMLIVTRDDAGFDVFSEEEATENSTHAGHVNAWAYLKEVGENNVPRITTPDSTTKPLTYTFEIGSEPKFLAVMTKNAHYVEYIDIEWEKSADPEVKIIAEDATSITVAVDHKDYILYYKKIHNDDWNNNWGSEAAKAPARVDQNISGETLADSEQWVSTGTNTITIDKTIADHKNRHYKFTAFHKDDTELANELNHVNFIIDSNGTLTGIEGIAAEAGADAPAEYYDLQGRRVANPVAGLYLRRTGSKVEKVLVK